MNSIELRDLVVTTFFSGYLVFVSVFIAFLITNAYNRFETAYKVTFRESSTFSSLISLLLLKSQLTNERREALKAFILRIYLTNLNNKELFNTEFHKLLPIVNNETDDVIARTLLEVKSTYLERFYHSHFQTPIALLIFLGCILLGASIMMFFVTPFLMQFWLKLFSSLALLVVGGICVWFITEFDRPYRGALRVNHVEMWNSVLALL